LTLFALAAGSGAIEFVLSEPMVTSATADQTTHPAFRVGVNFADDVAIVTDLRDQTEAFAQAIAPFAQATLTGTAITAGATFTVTRPLLNALPFTRFHGRVIGGTGSVVVNVIAIGVVHGPVVVNEVGRTDVISVTVPIGTDIQFSLQSVTGAPTAVLLELEGVAA
jgi:hypothetical protein